MVATVVSEVIELPIVVGFTVTNDETSCTEKYYVSKSQLYSYGAATGDIVEILISSQIHEA